MSADEEYSAGERVSERDRIRVAALLRRRLRQGRISADTFAWRLDAALDARYQRDLATLTDDLPAGRVRRVGTALAGVCRDAVTTARAALHRPQRIRLMLPPPGAPPILIGRGDTCDLVIGDDMTLSARHAQLRSVPTGWLLTDLRSRNGTWVNGARLLSASLVGPGDVLNLGANVFVLVPTAPGAVPAPPPMAFGIPGPGPGPGRRPAAPAAPAIPGAGRRAVAAPQHLAPALPVPAPSAGLPQVPPEPVTPRLTIPLPGPPPHGR